MEAAANANDNDLRFRLGFESHPQARTMLDGLTKAVEAAQKKIDRAMSGIGDALSSQARQSTAIVEQNGQAVLVHARDTAAKIAETASGLNRTLDAHRKADTQSAQERVDSEKLFNEAIVVAEKKAAHDRLSIQKQLEIDLAAIKRAEGIGTPRTLEEGLAVQAAEDAAKRVSAIGKRAQEEQARQVKETERNLQRETAAREKAAREAERIRKAELAAEERDRRESLKVIEAVKRERGRLDNENRTLAAQAANPWIEAYQSEMTAHERAVREMSQGRARFVSGLGQSATAIGKLSRGVVLLGLAKGEEMERVIRQLAVVQSAVDTMAGTGELIRGVSRTWESLRLITLGNVKAKQAEAAAGRIATTSSTQLSAALSAEALSANRAAVAHSMLGRARTASAVGGAVGRVGGGVAAGAAGSAVGSVGGAAAGGALTQIATAAAAKAVAAKAAVAAGAAAAAIPAAIAAITGFIVWRVKEATGEIRGGGATPGSFTDTVGGSDWNPFSALIAWSERAEAAQSEERTKRMEHASALLRIENAHRREIHAIRKSAARELAELDRNSRREILDREMQFARTPEARLGINAQQRTAAVAERGRAMMDARRAEDGSEDQVRSIQDVVNATNRLISTREQELQLNRQIQDERRRQTMDEIKGIEDTINALRKKEQDLENQHRSAKARFGAMSELDQRRTLDALERARRDPTNISEVDYGLLGNLDTDEARRLRENRDLARADAAGFEDAVGGETRERRAEINRGLDSAFGDLADRSGQTEGELREAERQGRLSGQSNVEIVDRREFEIKSEQLDRDLVKKMMDEINDMIARRDEFMRQLVDEENAKREAEATAEANRQKAQEGKLNLN